MSDAGKLSAPRQVTRWLVMGVFVFIAVLYLYGAVESFRAAGEPGGLYSLGWSRRALGQLCFALAALSFGIGLFRGIRTFPRATGGSAVFIVLAGLFAIAPYIGQFFLMDDCHQRGESWNRDTLQCTDE